MPAIQETVNAEWLTFRIESQFIVAAITRVVVKIKIGCYQVYPAGQLSFFIGIDISLDEIPVVLTVEDGGVNSILVDIQLLSLIHISEPTRQAEISYAVFC